MKKPAPHSRRIQRKPNAAIPAFHRAVYRVVRQIPRGKVSTYGQIAAILGHPRAARAVGQALRMLPRPLHSVVPWQRVINAGGRVSHRGDIARPDLQRELLEREGVPFSRGGVVPLPSRLWSGPKREQTVPLRTELSLDTGNARQRRARPSRR